MKLTNQVINRKISKKLPIERKNTQGNFNNIKYKLKKTRKYKSKLKEEKIEPKKENQETINEENDNNQQTGGFISALVNWFKNSSKRKMLKKIVKIFKKIIESIKLLKMPQRKLSLYNKKLKFNVDSHAEDVNMLMYRYQELIIYQKREFYYKALKSKGASGDEDPDYIASQIKVDSIEILKIKNSMKMHDSKRRARQPEIEKLKKSTDKEKLRLENKEFKKIEAALEAYAESGEQLEEIRIQMKNYALEASIKSKEKEDKEVKVERLKAESFYKFFRNFKVDEKKVAEAYEIYSSVAENIRDIEVSVANYHSLNKQYKNQTEQYEKIQTPLHAIFNDILPQVIGNTVRLDSVVKEFDGIMDEYKRLGPAVTNTIIPRIKINKDAIIQAGEIITSIQAELKIILNYLFTLNPLGSELSKSMELIITNNAFTLSYLHTVMEGSQSINSILERGSAYGGGKKAVTQRGGVNDNIQIDENDFKGNLSLIKALFLLEPNDTVNFVNNSFTSASTEIDSNDAQNIQELVNSLFSEPNPNDDENETDGEGSESEGSESDGEGSEYVISFDDNANLLIKNNESIIIIPPKKSFMITDNENNNSIYMFIKKESREEIDYVLYIDFKINENELESEAILYKSCNLAIFNALFGFVIDIKTNFNYSKPSHIYLLNVEYDASHYDYETHINTNEYAFVIPKDNQLVLITNKSEIDVIDNYDDSNTYILDIDVYHEIKILDENDDSVITNFIIIPENITFYDLNNVISNHKININNFGSTTENFNRENETKIINSLNIKENNLINLTLQNDINFDNNTDYTDIIKKEYAFRIKDKTTDSFKYFYCQDMMGNSIINSFYYDFINNGVQLFIHKQQLQNMKIIEKCSCVIFVNIDNNFYLCDIRFPSSYLTKKIIISVNDVILLTDESKKKLYCFLEIDDKNITYLSIEFNDDTLTTSKTTKITINLDILNKEINDTLDINQTIYKQNIVRLYEKIKEGNEPIELYVILYDNSKFIIKELNENDCLKSKNKSYKIIKFNDTEKIFHEYNNGTQTIFEQHTNFQNFTVITKIDVTTADTFEILPCKKSFLNIKIDNEGFIYYHNNKKKMYKVKNTTEFIIYLVNNIDNNIKEKEEYYLVSSDETNDKITVYEKSDFNKTHIDYYIQQLELVDEIEGGEEYTGLNLKTPTPAEIDNLMLSNRIVISELENIINAVQNYKTPTHVAVMIFKPIIDYVDSMSGTPASPVNSYMASAFPNIDTSSVSNPNAVILEKNKINTNTLQNGTLSWWNLLPQECKTAILVNRPLASLLSTEIQNALTTPLTSASGVMGPVQGVMGPVQGMYATGAFSQNNAWAFGPGGMGMQGFPGVQGVQGAVQQKPGSASVELVNLIIENKEKFKKIFDTIQNAISKIQTQDKLFRTLNIKFREMASIQIMIKNMAPNIDFPKGEKASIFYTKDKEANKIMTSESPLEKLSKTPAYTNMAKAMELQLSALIPELASKYHEEAMKNPMKAMVSQYGNLSSLLSPETVENVMAKNRTGNVSFAGIPGMPAIQGLPNLNIGSGTSIGQITGIAGFPQLRGQNYPAIDARASNSMKELVPYIINAMQQKDYTEFVKVMNNNDASRDVKKSTALITSIALTPFGLLWIKDENGGLPWLITKDGHEAYLAILQELGNENSSTAKAAITDLKNIYDKFKTKADQQKGSTATAEAVFKAQQAMLAAANPK